MDLRHPPISSQRSPPRRSSRAPVSLAFCCDPRLLERYTAFQSRHSPPSHPQPSFPTSRAQNPVDNRPELLARRVLTLEAFTAEIMNANGTQNKQSGKPIPVPLQPGESVRDYERRFFEWLHTKKARIDTASKERILRFQFAYSRLPRSAGKQTQKTSSHVHVDSLGKYGGTASKYGDAHGKNVDAPAHSKYANAHSNYGEVSIGYAETHKKYDEAHTNYSDVNVPLKLAHALSLKRKLTNTQGLHTGLADMKRKRLASRDPRLRSEDRVNVLPIRAMLSTKEPRQAYKVALQVPASTFTPACRNPEFIAQQPSSAYEQTQTESLTFSPSFSTKQPDLIAKPSAQPLMPSEYVDATQQEKNVCAKQPQSWTQNLAGPKLSPCPATAAGMRLDLRLTSEPPQQNNIDCPDNVKADTHPDYDQVIPSWAKALMQRVESLEEEVKQLRQELATSTKIGVTSFCMLEGNGVQHEITIEGDEVEQDCERERLETDFLDANDEIVLNDRAVNESEVLVLDLMETQPQQAQELQCQIEEMRDAIAAESAKRDAALASLISYSWGDKMQEFRELTHVSQLENVSACALSSPPNQQASHIKCQALWSKLKLQNRAVATHSRAPARENGEQKKHRLSLLLDSKAAREQTRRELDAEYAALFRSSERVRDLVAQLRVSPAQQL